MRLLVCLLFPVWLFSQPPSLLPDDAGGQLVRRNTYTLSYAEAHEQAFWVAYELRAEWVDGPAKRRNSFRPDPAIVTGSAELEDYRYSTYDRGHLMPAGDAKRDAETMYETFFLSNMTPQEHSFNAGVWNRLENQVRQWARQYDWIYVVTGPVLDRPIARIGENEVSVAAYFYKIVIRREGESYRAVAFLIPHLESSRELRDYVVSVDMVEEKTSVDFAPALPDSLEDVLEAEVAPDLWFEPIREPVAEAQAIPHYEAETAGAHLGEKAVVCGTVVRSKTLGGGVTVFDLERPFPEAPFNFVVFAAERGNFPEEIETQWIDRRVCVRGRISSYRGRPQMRVYHPNQLDTP